MKNLFYFRNSFIFTFFMMVMAAFIGYIYERTVAGILGTLFITMVLSVLEVSLSFDNAVVNATVLKNMTPVWQRRFLTWGIAIAVFGMRLVFPVVIVCVVAKLGPIAVLKLAALEPVEYSRILTSAHHLIAAFGGSFLAMVCLKFFFDTEKDSHWLHLIETRLIKLGRIEAIEIAILLLCLYFISRFLPEHEQAGFIISGMFGLITFVLVDGVAIAMEVTEESMKSAHRASAMLFLYLEILDASFSFDGVIGAFALTNNLFIIATGLGIGAMFVRSLTIMLLEQGTLANYLYLEHGAFYAIGALALIMFLGTFIEIPEMVTGLIGAGFIGLSLWASIRHKRHHGEVAHKECG